jgi:hypothetical protein
MQRLSLPNYYNNIPSRLNLKIKYVGDLGQVCGFNQVLLFPSSIKLTAMI